ncbi:hypothetical protein SDC9_192450 [bioreactor metagenome]|uniref:Spore coat protein n=1 Tax=bioreactor metagenome TaxID=1076179 RepID=A0A645IBR8_9ZZZZ
MANLTSKELVALDDQLSAENLLVKKYKTMSQQANDQVLKTKFEQIAAKHQDHYNRLYSYLQ